jgi:hypothetical protein
VHRGTAGRNTTRSTLPYTVLFYGGLQSVIRVFVNSSGWGPLGHQAPAAAMRRATEKEQQTSVFCGPFRAAFRAFRLVYAFYLRRRPKKKRRGVISGDFNNKNTRSAMSSRARN